MTVRAAARRIGIVGAVGAMLLALCAPAASARNEPLIPGAGLFHYSFDFENSGGRQTIAYTLKTTVSPKVVKPGAPVTITSHFLQTRTSHDLTYGCEARQLTDFKTSPPKVLLQRAHPSSDGRWRPWGATSIDIKMPTANARSHVLEEQLCGPTVHRHEHFESFKLTGAMTKTLGPGCYYQNHHHGFASHPGSNGSIASFSIGGVACGAVAPIVDGVVGVTCGTAKFDWYEVSKQPSFVKSGEKACTFLLSNAAAKEVLSRAVKNGTTLTDEFGGVIARELARKYGAAATEKVVLAGVEYGLKREGWKAIASGVPRALVAFRNVNGIALVGKGVALTAVPLAGLTILDQIKNDKACVQIDADIDDGKLKLDWNLVYSPSALKDPVADAEMTYSKVRDRVEKDFASDELETRRTGLRCGEFGEVLKAGGSSTAFTGATTAGAL